MSFVNLASYRATRASCHRPMAVVSSGRSWLSSPPGKNLEQMHKNTENFLIGHNNVGQSLCVFVKVAPCTGVASPTPKRLHSPQAAVFLPPAPTLGERQCNGEIKPQVELFKPKPARPLKRSYEENALDENEEKKAMAKKQNTDFYFQPIDQNLITNSVHSNYHHMHRQSSYNHHMLQRTYNYNLHGQSTYNHNLHGQSTYQVDSQTLFSDDDAMTD